MLLFRRAGQRCRLRNGGRKTTWRRQARQGLGLRSNGGTSLVLRALTRFRREAGQPKTGVFVEDRDFWHVAQHLIRLHGPQAEFDAALRAERARLAGDRTGHEIWRLVMYKVSALQREPLPSELH